MGSLYKRGNTWWIKYYRQGRPIRESSKSRKKTVAEKLLKLREGEIVQGKTPGLYFDKVTFDDLAEDLKTDYRMNGRKTLDRVLHSLKHLEPFFGGYPVPRITTSRIKEYIVLRIDEGAASATVNRELAALKRMLRLGAEADPPKVARVPKIAMLTENNARKGFYEHSEFLTLRDNLPQDLQGFITFAYKTGWRLREITGLTWDRVDRRQGIIRLEVGETKNDEAREIYLDDELRGVIRKQFKKRHLGCPYVFHRKGKPIREFRSDWKKACKAAKLEGRIFHDFRRTAVRNMVRAGVPERVAMMVSGHKTRTVFERYNIVNAADLKWAAKRQEEYLRELA